MIGRALVIAAIAAATVGADASSETFDVIASMAAGLAEDNAAAFMKPVDDAMPGREALAANVRALLLQSEVVSGIDRVRDDGSEASRTLVLDWGLQLKRRGPDLRIERKRETVTVTLKKDGKRWKVTSIVPLEFFAPPEFR